MEGHVSISSVLLFASFGLLGTVCFLLKLRHVRKLDGREPPVIYSKIPFLGHAINLLLQGSVYFIILSERLGLPIYTLPVLTGRLYIVNDAHLASAIQRRPEVFSFDPFMIIAAERLAGTTTEGMKHIRASVPSGHLEQGLVADIRKRVHTYLNSSSSLQSMSRGVFGNLAVAFQDLDSNDGIDANLSSWVKHAISIASTNAIYGPRNPFVMNSQIYNAFWDYEENLSSLLVNVLPKVTATRAYNGREVIAKAFTKYFEDGDWIQGSDLIQASCHANSLRSVSYEDQARFELTTCIGLLVNTVPAVLWMLFHVLSDVKLLQDLRSELLANVTVESSSGKQGCRDLRLSMTALNNLCPLLNSTLQEVLRYHSTSLSAKWVKEDTILNRRYLLKAGSIIQIPAAVLHKDPHSWGSKAMEFDASRFIRPTEGFDAVQRPAAASRAFGGGSRVCPGRKLATTEILIFVAIFILQFDAEPIGGPWSLPKLHYVNLTHSVMPSPKDLRTRITRREVIKESKWVSV